MSVTVIPYNPWKEQLAVNVLGGLLNNFLEQNRQAEQNRKVNAFRSQLQQDLQNNIARQQEQNVITLAQPQTPNGYNSNPWAGAFHQTDSPLLPFDIGTSVIPMRDPTVQEINNTADTLGGTSRFSMINPETIQGIKSALTQQAEAQRLRNLQESFATQFGNAQDLNSRINVALQGAMQGVVPHQIPNILGELAVADRNARSALDVARTNAAAGMGIANMNNDTALSRLDMERQAILWGQENPELKFVKSKAGSYYVYNPRDGSATPITDERGNQIAGAEDMDDYTKYSLQSIDARTKILDDQMRELEKTRNSPSILLEPDERNKIEQQIKELQEQSNVLWEERRKLTSKLQTGNREQAEPSTPKVMPESMGGNVQPISVKQIPASSFPTTVSADKRVNIMPFSDPFPQPNWIHKLASPESPFAIPTTTSVSVEPIVEQRESTPSPNLLPIPLSSDVASETHGTPQIMPRTMTQKQETGKKVVLKGNDLPSDMWYSPVKDSNIPSDKIITREQLGKTIARIMSNSTDEGTRILTPVVIAYRLFKNGYRVKQ